MADQLTDLLTRVRAGEESAVADLVARFGESAGRLAVALVGDVHLAEDVVQDAFVTALARLSELRSAEAFPAWFRQIVRTQANRHLRRRHEQTGIAVDEPIAGSPSEIERLEHGELCENVRAALRRLPPIGREAAEMFYLEERSIAEVASSLHVPAGTIKRRLHDARLELRRFLRPLVGPDRDPFDEPS